MTQRLDYMQIAPGGMKALGGVHGYLLQSGLPVPLINLVHLRTSQINVAQTGVPDAEFDAVRAVFNDKELSDLTIAIALMNAYNRLGISFRAVPAAAQRHQPEAEVRA